MARSRNIKPGFFKNEVLVELPFETRLLFIGLWTMADREGRLEDRPTKIKMEIFAADNVDVSGGLDALEKKGFIMRYEVDGKSYISIIAWSKHQNPHPKEAASLIPEPVMHEDKAAAFDPCMNDKPGKGGDEQQPRSARAGLIPDSLHSSTLIPDSGKKKKDLSGEPDGFAEFYESYPRKQAKQEAIKAWRRLSPDGELRRKMADALEIHKRSSQWRKDGAAFVPLPASWINSKRWEDEIQAMPSSDQSFLRSAI